MELGILIAFMAATFVLMIFMSYIFHGWLKQRGPLIEKKDETEH